MNYKWYAIILLLCFFIFTRCDSNYEKYFDFEEIEIIKEYPFYLEQIELGDIDDSTLGFFEHKVHMINSVAQLNDNPLFAYCPPNLKQEIIECDFEVNSLIMVGSRIGHKVVDIENSTFGYNNSYSTYIYSQELLCEYLEDEHFYLIISAISVMKIEDSPKLSYSVKIGLK